VELLLKDAQALVQFRQHGAVFLTRAGRRETVPVTASLAGEGTSVIGNLLITTKAHQTMAALHTAAPRLAQDCRLLLVQNGMGVTEQIAASFPALPLFCGVTTDGAYCPVRFSVIQAAVGETHIGGYREASALDSLLDDLPLDYLQIEGCGDLIDRQWQKLAVNCVINPLTAIYHCRNGELLKIRQARQRLKQLCAEIAEVGAALGYPKWRDELLAGTESVVRLTAGNYSSMYQDVDNGRATEIDYLNGYLIGRAKQLGIACPENERVYDEMKALEKSSR